MTAKQKGLLKAAIAIVLYLLFLYWVGSWWGLIVVPFIFDVYVTKKIKWGWWKNLKNRTARSIMAWVDAIVFALVAVYFLNQFFVQNFVIPSSSLEKTLLTGDYLLVSKYSLAAWAPVYRIFFFICQSSVIELYEEPLHPFIVFRTACLYFSVPVI